MSHAVMTGETIVLVVATALLLLGAALWRQRGREARGRERAESSAEPRNRAPQAGMPPGTLSTVGLDTTSVPTPPHDPDGPGMEVLEHLRRLEARASPGLAAHVIPIFLLDTAARLAALREATARKDADAVHRVAHTLHGSAATVGATSLVGGCAEIIMQVRSGSFDRCEAVTAKLDADFESIRRTLAGADLDTDPRRKP